jgi:hypothetical protein
MTNMSQIANVLPDARYIHFFASMEDENKTLRSGWLQIYALKIWL